MTTTVYILISPIYYLTCKFPSEINIESVTNEFHIKRKTNEERGKKEKKQKQKISRNKFCKKKEKPNLQTTVKNNKQANNKIFQRKLNKTK